MYMVYDNKDFACRWTSKKKVPHVTPACCTQRAWLLDLLSLRPRRPFTEYSCMDLCHKGKLDVTKVQNFLKWYKNETSYVIQNCIPSKLIHIFILVWFSVAHLSHFSGFFSWPLSPPMSWCLASSVDEGVGSRPGSLKASADSHQGLIVLFISEDSYQPNTSYVGWLGKQTQLWCQDGDENLSQD